MKSLTPRERTLVTFLPAGIFLVVYVIFFARPAGEEMKELRRQVGVAQDRVPSAREQSEVLTQLRNLESELNEKRTAARERIERSEAVLALWSDPDAKARAGVFIGNQLAANGVVLVEEIVASDEDRKAFTALLEPLPPAAELWRLRVAGSYDAMRRTIATIGKTQLPLVPAGIEMEPMVEGNNTIHLWSLWICR